MRIFQVPCFCRQHQYTLYRLWRYGHAWSGTGVITVASPPPPPLPRPHHICALFPHIVNTITSATQHAHAYTTQARSATRRHRRQASDTSARTFISLHSSDATGMEDSISLTGSLKPSLSMSTTVDEMTIFIDDLPKNVVCMFCNSIFSEPVIVKCGHTFCKSCLLKLPPGGQCPVHKKTLVRIDTRSHYSVVTRTRAVTRNAQSTKRPSYLLPRFARAKQTQTHRRIDTDTDAQTQTQTHRHRHTERKTERKTCVCVCVCMCV